MGEPTHGAGVARGSPSAPRLFILDVCRKPPYGWPCPSDLPGRAARLKSHPAGLRAAAKGRRATIGPCATPLASSFTVAVSGNTQLQMQMTYYNGDVDTFTSSASWSSSDTSIATVGNGSTAGLTTGVSAGSMDMYASLSGIPTTTGEVCDPSGYCPSSDPEGEAGGTSAVSYTHLTLPTKRIV